MIRRFLFCLIFQMCLVPLVARASWSHNDGQPVPQAAFAVGSGVNGGASAIYRIDAFDTAPAADPLVNSGLYLGDIGINPATGDAYVIEGHAPGRLYSLDLDVGTLTLVGATGIHGLNSLEVGIDGTIYTRASNSTLVWTLDPQTAVAASLVDTHYSGGGDLALTPDGALLYATANLGAGLSTALVQIDVAHDNAVTPVGGVLVDGASRAWAGIDFDSAGQLYGFLGNDSIGLAQVYRIDLGMHVATFVGDVAGAQDFGLLGAAIIPEPAGAAGLALMVWLVRRRR